MNKLEDKKIMRLSEAGLLGTALIWGFAFVIVKNSVDSVPPVYMLAFRFTIAALGLMIIFARRLKNISRRDLRCGAFLGIFLFLSYFFQTVGIQYTTAGKNAFLTTVYVVIVPFLHWLINRKKPDKYCVCAAFLAVVGIGLLSLNGDLSMNVGDVLTLICGLGYALHMIFIDRYARTQDPVILTVVQIAVAALLSWLLAPAMDGGFPMGALAPDMITGMLYLGLGSTMLAFLLQNVCQKYTNPSTTSLLLSMESVFGALFSILFLGEWMSGRMVVGCVLIFIAITMAETKFDFIKKRGKEYGRSENAA